MIPFPRRQSPFPNLAHVERHVRAFARTQGTEADMLRLLPFFLEAKSNKEIAAESGFSPARIMHNWLRIRDMLTLRTGRTGYGRMELLRLVMGLDQCWCQK